MTDRELMQQALDALSTEGIGEASYRAAEALRARLAQPKREWQGLTDEDRQICFDDTQEASGGFWDFASAIEAKLKEKNT